MLYDKGTILMNTIKSNTHISPFISLINLLATSLLASLGISAVLMGIVLLLSLVS